ncbi:uncharacterized protein LOC125381948 [Haliotis rufescens]|uniref:uncharacterized protein LOC125381948 n=1 Tax=Haliotis rufescens TaxID=6454 RepID=UPI00201FA688|nr:uncharacterized protein LOC125381948 [Haliotis rufescens]
MACKARSEAPAPVQKRKVNSFDNSTEQGYMATGYLAGESHTQDQQESCFHLQTDNRSGLNQSLYRDCCTTRGSRPIYAFTFLTKVEWKCCLAEQKGFKFLTKVEWKCCLAEQKGDTGVESHVHKCMVRECEEVL